MLNLRLGGGQHIETCFLYVKRQVAEYFSEKGHTQTGLLFDLIRVVFPPDKGSLTH